MMAFRVAACALCIAVLAMSGCAIPVPGADGTRHYVVVGIGVLSIPKVATDAPVTAVKLQAVGLVATPAPGPRLVVGYTKSYQVEAAAHAKSMLLEMSDSFAGPLTIRTEIPDSQENDQ